MEKEETNECTFKVLTEKDIEVKEKEPETYTVYLTRERQEQIKKLMFSALEDPRAKLEKVNMDDLENYWKNKHGC